MNFESNQIFFAKGKLDEKYYRYKYVKKLRGVWHLILAHRSGNLIEVENEWFNQRSIKNDNRTRI